MRQCLEECKEGRESFLSFATWMYATCMSDKYGEIHSLAIVPSLAVVPSLVVPSLAVVPSAVVPSAVVPSVKEKSKNLQRRVGKPSSDAYRKETAADKRATKRAAELLTGLGGGHKHTLLKRHKGDPPLDSDSVDY